MVSFTNKARGWSVGFGQRHSQTTMWCIPAAGVARCLQLSSSYQVRKHRLPFQTFIMVKITPAGPLSSSWAGQDANRGQHSGFLPQPLLQYMCTVHSHLCVTRNTWHPRGNIVKEDAKSFLQSSYLGPAPLATTADTAQWHSLSFSLTHRAGTGLPFLLARGTRVDQIIRQQNKCGFLPISCSIIHAISFIQ